jgi:hypothetical protein
MADQDVPRFAVKTARELVRMAREHRRKPHGGMRVRLAEQPFFGGGARSPDIIWFTATGAKSTSDDSVTATVFFVLHGEFGDESGESQSEGDTDIVVWDPDPGAKGYEAVEGTRGRATRGNDGKFYIDIMKCVEEGSGSGSG